MGYEPLHHALVSVHIKKSLQNKVGKIYRYFRVFFKILIPLTLVRYEAIIPNSALWTMLAISHLISNAHSWNNYFYNPKIINFQLNVLLHHLFFTHYS